MDTRDTCFIPDWVLQTRVSLMIRSTTDVTRSVIYIFLHDSSRNKTEILNRLSVTLAHYHTILVSEVFIIIITKVIIKR